MAGRLRQHRPRTGTGTKSESEAATAPHASRARHNSQPHRARPPHRREPVSGRSHRTSTASKLSSEAPYRPNPQRATPPLPESPTATPTAQSEAPSPRAPCQRILAVLVASWGRLCSGAVGDGSTEGPRCAARRPPTPGTRGRRERHRACCGGTHPGDAPDEQAAPQAAHRQASCHPRPDRQHGRQWQPHTPVSLLSRGLWLRPLETSCPDGGALH